MIPKLLPQERIGERLKELREARGWSQPALAARMKRRTGNPVTQGEVSRWEKGEVMPGDSTVAMWAEALEVSGVMFMDPDTLPSSALDEWGMARARIVERILAFLDEDRKIFSMRTETALNLSRAAVLEAEKAPDRSGGLSAPVSMRDEDDDEGGKESA